MIQILLLILKIIGIVLAVLLLTVLVLLAVVLFVPVQYRAKVVHNPDRTEISGRASFLYPLVVFRFHYFEKVFSYKGRAFWYVFADSGKNKEEPEEKEPEVKREKPEEPTVCEKEPEEAREEIKIKKIRPKKKKKQNPLEIIKRLLHQKDEVVRILSKPESKQAISFAWDKVKKTLRHILPRKVKGYLIYGSGDPASTGQFLGVVSVLYAAMGPVLKIVPDFEEKRLECDLEFRGRLQIFTLLVILFKLYFNKQLKQLLQEFKGIKEIE